MNVTFRRTSWRNPPCLSWSWLILLMLPGTTRPGRSRSGQMLSAISSTVQEPFLHCGFRSMPRCYLDSPFYYVLRLHFIHGKKQAALGEEACSTVIAVLTVYQDGFGLLCSDVGGLISLRLFKLSCVGLNQVDWALLLTQTQGALLWWLTSEIPF